MDSTVTGNINQLIDVEGVLAKRNPKLKRLLPGVVINALKKIIHQNDINDFLTRFGHKKGLDFVEAALIDFKIDTNAFGIENLNENGRYIFAANHPLGGMDGLAIIHEVGKRFPDVKAVINDLLLNLKSLEPVFQGVNVFGNNSREHIRLLDDLFASEKQVIVFPAGMVSRKTNGVIMDLEWKKSFVSKAIQHKRDIVPVFINGKNSNLFYNMANLRKYSGIKANIELILLPGELYKYKNKTINLTFGEPIPYQSLTNEKTHDEWALEIKKKVYALR